MSKTTVHVWHTNEGQIIAIGRPAKGAKHPLVPVSSAGQSVMAIDVDASAIATLHRTHVVDVSKKALVSYKP